MRRNRGEWLLLFGAWGVLATGCAAGVGQGGGGPVDTRAIVAVVPVGEGPTYLALSPDGSRLYAASNAQLSVISTASNRVVATVATAPYPAGLALTPDGQRAFITNLFSVSLTVVDTAANTLLPPLGLFAERFRGGFGRITITADGRTAYVANVANQVLALADLVTREASSLEMDMQPVDIAVSADGRTAYVAGCKNFCATGTVEVVDTRSQQVTASITVGAKPYRIVLSPDERRAYTTNLGDPSVSVVDLATRNAVATIAVPVEPTGLAVSRDGASIFVASQPPGTLTVISSASNAVTTSVKVADNVREVVLGPDGRRAYVSTLHSVVVVDTAALVQAP
jgi:YVTN family beta-propeller protein